MSSLSVNNKNNDAWAQKRHQRHAKALETLARQVGCETDGDVLWQRLLRLERQFSHQAVRYCNGEIDTEAFEKVTSQTTAKLAKIFGGRLPEGVIINNDPRGYALKLDPEQVTLPEGLAKDFGGYGVLATEVN